MLRSTFLEFGERIESLRLLPQVPLPLLPALELAVATSLIPCMSPELHKPVHNQMAVATFKGPLNGEYHGDKKFERRNSGKRRVFVQTEAGSVLGIELDRSDNAHTVKRKLRLALDVPTDESSLVCGDMVLKNDLSIVRNYSPLLLTKNFLHRSSSTPCLSPTGKDLQQRDQSSPIEVLGYSDQFARKKKKKLVRDIVKAVRNEIDPVPVHSGLGGGKSTVLKDILKESFWSGAAADAVVVEVQLVCSGGCCGSATAVKVAVQRRSMAVQRGWL